MNLEDLAAFKTWFAAYCAAFSTPVPEDQRNISVKQDHTREVCLNAVRIGRGLHLSDGDLLLAETIALFHDVGRFPQFERYKTFDDSISVNHAALGAQVLREQNVLARLPKQDRDLIIHAVTLHNVFSLPNRLNENTLLFARLVRDADKLDIWRVFAEYYDQSEDGRASAVALGLPDTPAYSRGILDRLNRREMAVKSDLRTLNDFKLLQLSWLYDLNFSGSLQIVLERGYIETIARLLPDDEGIRSAVGAVREYVTKKLAK